MTTADELTAGCLLATLHVMGVEAEVHGVQLVLRPRGSLTAVMIDALKGHKAAVLTLLADPRRRWRVQAEALVRSVVEPRRCDDLLEMYDEREAIAAIDGGLDDQAAGRLAYVTLIEALQEKGADCEQPNATVRGELCSPAATC